MRHSQPAGRHNRSPARKRWVSVVIEPESLQGRHAFPTSSNKLARFVCRPTGLVGRNKTSPRTHVLGYVCVVLRTLSTSPVPAAQVRPSVGLTLRQAQGGLWDDCPRHPEGSELVSAIPNLPLPGLASKRRTRTRGTEVGFLGPKETNFPPRSAGRRLIPYTLVPPLPEVHR